MKNCTWLIALLMVASVFAGGCGDRSPSEPPPPPAAEELPESAAEKIGSGNRALSRGDLDGASRLANEALLLDPENPQAMVLAGQVAIARGDLDAGVEMFDAAAALWPEQAMALQTQATGVYFQANRLAEAQQRFADLVSKYPTYDEARRGLATVLNRRGFRFDANQQLRILARRPNVQMTMDELRCLNAPSRAFFPFAEKPNVEDRAWIQSIGELNVARALFGEGDVRDALTVLENSNVLAERHPAAVAFYGQVLLESQLSGQFENWLREVEPECAAYPAYWMAIGGWALRRQKPEQAIRMFGESILREPGDIAAHDRMKQALAAAGQDATAKRFEERGIEIRSIVKMTSLLLNDPNLSSDAYRALAEKLDLVGRPFEAKSWRSLAMMRSGMPLEAARQGQAETQQLLKDEDIATTRQVLLCQLDMKRYPLDLAALMPTRSPSSATTNLSEPPPPAATPRFVNIANEVGLDYAYVNAIPPKDRYFLMHEAVGAGVACLDYDRDGWVDLYVGQGASNAPDGAGTQPNLLARNLGRRFEVVTDWAEADDRGYTLGVTAGDWNQDGFPDLVVGNMKVNRLLINQGDGTFQEQTGDEQWAHGIYTASLAMADVTGDHLPDIIEVNYVDDDTIYRPLEFGPEGRPVRFPGPLHFRAAMDRVFVGQIDGTMKSTELSTAFTGPGLGVVVTDIDGNVGNEIFVANDMTANQLWVRQGSPSNPTFVDTAVARGVAYGPSGSPLACMGIAAGDFDENGYVDFYITNFFDQWTNLYMQNSSNLFDDRTLPFGLDSSSLRMLGFGTQAFDFDNNSVMDLITGNGHIDDMSHEGAAFEMPTQIFVGDRKSFTLADVEGDPSYWQNGHLTRSLVTLDWNRDGKIDAVAFDLKKPLALLENRTESEHAWIQFELVGVTSERDAIGTRVTVHLPDGRQLMQTVQSGDGYMGKNEPALFFGLGTADKIEKLQIRWPDGTEQALSSPQLRRRWLVVQGQDL